MIRICQLTSVHPSTDVRIYHKECVSLAKVGFQVTLIAPEDRDRTRDGVNVVAVKRRTFRPTRMLLTGGEVFFKARRENATVYHFHDPELIPVGLLLRLLGKKVIYDVHEDLPRSILDKAWIAPWLRRSISLSAELTEAIGSRLFSAVVGATPAISSRFPPSKTVTVQNFPFRSEWTPLLEKPYQERPFNVIYAGVLSEARGASEMIRAIRLLPRGLGVRLTLIGSIYPESLEQKLRKAKGWKQVDFLGWQDRTQLGTAMGAARVGLVLFHPMPNHINSQPNKIFEYMAAGIPVVASHFPLWQELIGRNRCGLLVDPKNPKAIADAIRWLIENPKEGEAMGLRGQKAIKDRYNWESESKNLTALYERLTE